MRVKILTESPTVACIAEPALNFAGLAHMVQWTHANMPELEVGAVADLWGQGRTFESTETAAERLCELAGRTCYHSYGNSAGRKTNEAYLAHIHEVGHTSVLYHAKFTFFIAGISRRVAMELIRHYVGADRDLEGSPSMLSTRYTKHSGRFVAPPRDMVQGNVERFASVMQDAYDDYLNYLTCEHEAYEHEFGARPKGVDRKRIYEAAAGLLPGQAETSLVWTTNAVALEKMFRERCASAADLEFQRLAGVWRRMCHNMWPNLFPLTSDVAFTEDDLP